MVDQMDIFLKNLEKLRELDQQGQGADPKKFDALAKSLLWDVKRNNPLNIPLEQLDLFKIMTTSEVAGDYWKGYGAAITDFLLPLLRASDMVAIAVREGGQTPFEEKKIIETSAAEVTSQSANDGFKLIMD